MIAVLLLDVAVGPPWTQSPLRPHRRPPLPAGAVAGPVVPGLREGAVPQGLAWAPGVDSASGGGPPLFLISHDRPGDAASCVSVLDATTGKLRAVVELAEPDGAPHTGHVGGLAVAVNRVFVASDDRVLTFPLAPLRSRTPPATLPAILARQDETRASYCTARSGPAGDELWTGEFARTSAIPFSKQFPTDESHHIVDRAGRRKRAWVCRSDPADPTGRVTGVLSVRQRVQGLAFLPNAVGAAGEIVLSVSYGRTNRSALAVYRDPTGDPPHRTVRLPGDGDAGDGGEREAPLWFLDAENHLRTVDFPPMSEGVAFVRSSSPRLAVLTESGATKYRTGGAGPLDVLTLLPVARLQGSARAN